MVGDGSKDGDLVKIAVPELEEECASIGKRIVGQEEAVNSRSYMFG